MVSQLGSDQAPPALEVKEAYKQALAEARSLVVDGRLTVDLDGHQEPPPANDTGEPPTGPTAEDPAPDSDAPGVASEPDPATTPTKKYRVHPAAAIYPMMSATEIQALATSLREIGQQEPIIVSPDDEELYDGRNRLAACELAGIEPWIVRWSGTGSVVMWITSKNLHRRHLTDQQRALAAGKMAALLAEEARSRSARNLRNSPDIVDGRNSAHRAPTGHGGTVEGGDQSAARESADGTNGQEIPEIVDGRNSAHRAAGRSAEVAAAVHGVTPDAAKKAAKILKTGDEQLVDAVSKGTVSLDAAAAVAGLPKKQQRKVVEAGKVKEAAKRIRKEKAASKSKPQSKPKVNATRAAKPVADDNTKDEAPTVDPPASGEDGETDHEDQVDERPLARSAHQAIDEMVRAAEEAGRLEQVDRALLAIINHCGKVTRSFIDVDLPPMISSA